MKYARSSSFEKTVPTLIINFINVMFAFIIFSFIVCSFLLIYFPLETIIGSYIVIFTLIYSVAVQLVQDKFY